MVYTFDILGKLPTLNEYSKAERTNRHMAAKLKRETQDSIIAQIPQNAPSFNGAVLVAFRWVRPDMRCDKDNVAFAKKFILDALQEAGIITTDSWKLCTPYDIGFAVNKQNPRTIVTIANSYDEIRKETA